MNHSSDNVNSFADDLEGLLNDIPSPKLEVMGVDVVVSSPKNIFKEQKQKAWNRSIEARCDFNRKLRITRHATIPAISIWQKSLYGRTLKEIKADDAMVNYFAENIAPVILDTLGSHLQNGDWALITTPKRRHKERNFATLVSQVLSPILGIPFYEDVAFCKNKDRLNLDYTLNVLPKEQNIIVFDDIVTTGNTIHAIRNLLDKENKNLIFFVGINNNL